MLNPKLKHDAMTTALSDWSPKRGF